MCVCVRENGEREREREREREKERERELQDTGKVHALIRIYLYHNLVSFFNL